MAYTEQPLPRMRVTDPIGQAISRSKFLLFERFDFGVWLRFGFIAFLSSLGSGGGSGSGSGGGGGNGSSQNRGPSVDEVIRDAHDWVLAHVIAVALVGAVVLLVLLSLSLLVIWLKSRGQLMLIHAVSTGDPAIGRAWSYTSRQGNSVFLFRIVFWFTGIAVTLLSLGYSAFVVVAIAQQEESAIWPYIGALVPVFLVFIACGLVFWAIELILGLFVLPLMYRFDTGVMDGWRQLRAVSAGNIGPMVLVILLRIVYSIAFTVVALLVGCLTCCIGFLPVIHHTLFAPFYVFDRAYSLYALQSLGPDFTFIVEPEMVYETPPPLPPAE